MLCDITSHVSFVPSMGICILDMAETMVEFLTKYALSMHIISRTPLTISSSNALDKSQWLL